MRTAEQIDAGKQTLGEEQALKLAAEVEEIYAAKGRKVVHLDLREHRPDRETLRKLLLGPTGNLRAPALRKGKTLIVGFDEPTYRKLLG